MSTDTNTETSGDVSDIDFGADANVGGNQYPFLSPGPEGGAGCNYVLELVESRYWRQPSKSANKKAKGPERFAFVVRVQKSDGEGATAEGALCTLLFCQDEYGYYMRDTKNTVKGFTGEEFSPKTANELFVKEHKDFGKHVGALTACQVTRNVKNPKFSVYVFEGPIQPDNDASNASGDDSEISLA